MKKYFLFGLLIAIMPNLCLGASARYTQLVREKQRKMEELEKCMGASKGLKIAGVSTLGLTAVGVVGNIAEANEIKKYDSQIASTDKKIEKIQTQIAESQEEAENKKITAKILADCKQKLTAENANTDKITKVEQDKDGNCKIISCDTGYKASEDAKSCEKDKSKVTKNTTATEKEFQTLCNEFSGSYNKDVINHQTKNQAGEVITVNIPVYHACVLSGENNTKENCEKLVKTCEEDKNHIHYENGICACIGNIKTECLNGEEVCYSDKSKEKNK